MLKQDCDFILCHIVSVKYNSRKKSTYANHIIRTPVVYTTRFITQNTNYAVVHYHSICLHKDMQVIQNIFGVRTFTEMVFDEIDEMASYWDNKLRPESFNAFSEAL